MARSDNPRKFRDSVLGQTHYDFVLKIMVVYPDYYTVECARNQRIRNANNLDRLLEGTMRKSSVSPLSRRDAVFFVAAKCVGGSSSSFYFIAFWSSPRRTRRNVLSCGWAERVSCTLFSWNVSIARLETKNVIIQRVIIPNACDIFPNVTLCLLTFTLFPL